MEQAIRGLKCVSVNFQEGSKCEEHKVEKVRLVLELEGSQPQEESTWKMNYQAEVSSSLAIRQEITRFESVHPNIYAIYDLLEQIDDPLLASRVRDHVVCIEGCLAAPAILWASLGRLPTEIRLARACDALVTIWHGDPLGSTFQSTKEVPTYALWTSSETESMEDLEKTSPAW
ncbi:hypothetical protein Bbelb_410310 [Branchiostoma belcheri]|nr:hypothetical protein Bbelb_410310 [Branchiostoma belcheri]